MSEQTITIPETTLRELVSAQIIAKFDDPKLLANFVTTMLEAQVDDRGYASSRGNVSMLQWSVRETVKDFVQELTREWLDEHRVELEQTVAAELSKSFVGEVAAKVIEKAGASVGRGF